MGGYVGDTHGDTTGWLSVNFKIFFGDVYQYLLKVWKKCNMKYKFTYIPWHISIEALADWQNFEGLTPSLLLRPLTIAPAMVDPAIITSYVVFLYLSFLPIVFVFLCPCVSVSLYVWCLFLSLSVNKPPTMWITLYQYIIVMKCFQQLEVLESV